MSSTPENLSFVQAVRKRPAMYIGSTTIRGIHLLLREFVRYAFTIGRSDYFTFEILDSNSGRMSFDVANGPLDEKLFSEPDFRDGSGRFVEYEPAVLNALSSSFQVRQTKTLSGASNETRFALGFKAFSSTDVLEPGPCRVTIDFKLDESIFSPSDRFDWNVLLEAFRTLAYLYAGKTIRVIYSVDERTGDAIFKFNRGLADLIDLQQLDSYYDSVFPTKVTHDFPEFSIDLAFYFRGTSADSPFLVSFVNEDQSTEGGTHVEGVLKGLLAALIHFQRESAESSNRELTFNGLSQLLVAAVHLRMDRPIFEGAIKGKVVSRDIVGPISNLVGDAFFTALRADTEKANNLVKMVAWLSEKS